jgi:hypothetical protein
MKSKFLKGIAFTLLTFYAYQPSVISQEMVNDASLEADMKPISTAQNQHSFEVGPEVFFYQYREPGVMMSRGAKFGLSGSYTYRADKLWSRIEGRFAAGQTNYKSFGTGRFGTKEDDYYYEFRGLLGLNEIFKIGSDTTITPYAGLGWRHLFNDGAGLKSSTGHHGYDRRNKMLYLPIGLETKISRCNEWGITVQTELDILLYGIQHSHLQKFGGGLLEHDQESGYGLRGAVSFDKKMSSYTLGIEPFVRYWSINDSNIVRGTLEPKNNTLETGLKISFKF